MKAVTKIEAVNIINDFVDSILTHEKWYQNISSSVKAIVLYGSVAKQNNRLDSDIDILLIVPLEIENKYTKGEYFYNFRNHEINIVLRSIERLRKIANDKKDLFQKEVFAKSKIIREQDGEVRRLIGQICK